MSASPLSPSETQPFRIVAAVRQLMQGRSNATGSVTLSPNAASTSVAAPSCAPGAQVFLFPTTAHAAAELGNGTLYVSAVATRAFTLTHADNTQTDRTFSYVCLG